MVLAETPEPIPEIMRPAGDFYDKAAQCISNTIDEGLKVRGSVSRPDLCANPVCRTNVQGGRKPERRKSKVCLIMPFILLFGPKSYLQSSNPAGPGRFWQIYAAKAIPTLLLVANPRF